MNTLTQQIIKNVYKENKDNNFVFSPASYFEAIHSLIPCIKGNNLSQLLEILQLEESDIYNYISGYKTILKDFNLYNLSITGEKTPSL